MAGHDLKRVERRHRVEGFDAALALRKLQHTQKPLCEDDIARKD